MLTASIGRSEEDSSAPAVRGIATTAPKNRAVATCLTSFINVIASRPISAEFEDLPHAEPNG
jgi:hypothetical protein